MRFHIQGPTSSKPYHLACPQHLHSGGQRGQTDGFTERYKNPPASRRLVGESHIPPNMSPAYTDLGSSLSRTRLAGEQGEVRTGPKTGFQLRRLLVRPQGGQGQTHTRALADLNRQDTVNPVRYGVPSPAVHVPHRTSNSHRKASPSRSTSYETHTVALEEQLEGTRITRKGDTHSQVAPPPFNVVAGGKQCAFRSTITPTKTCSADIYRRIKRRVGCSLKRTHCMGNLAPSRKQVAHKPLLHLFQDRKLQPGTNSTINVSKDENLTRLLDSFHRDRPKGRRGIPFCQPATGNPITPSHNFI